MLRLLVKIVYIQTIFSSPIFHEEDQILTKFISEFKNDLVIEDWMNARLMMQLDAPELFNETLSKILEILLDIKKANDFYVKSLILKTDMSLKKIGNPFYETFIIFKSVQRILKENEFQNMHKTQTYRLFRFKEEYLFKEYDELYNDLKETIIQVGFEYNSEETKKYYTRYMLNGPGNIYESLSVLCNLSVTTGLINLTNDMLESIIPNKISRPVQVEANFKGFKDSRKRLGKKILGLFTNRYISICPENMLECRLKCSREHSLDNQIDLKDFIDKVFFCNRTTVKFLITIFHFYSEIRERNTTYNLVLKDNGKYELTWFFVQKQPKEEIKKNWLQEEINELLKSKRIHKFGLLVDYQVEYSTIKSVDTEDNPIKTRLIMLSCGHQLGFELIDEFLDYFMSKMTDPLTCHVCRQPIFVVGSYDAVVYRCR